MENAVFLVVTESSGETESLSFSVPVCRLLHRHDLTSYVVLDAPSLRIGNSSEPDNNSNKMSK